MLKQKMKEHKKKYWWENPIENPYLNKLMKLEWMYRALRDSINEMEKRTNEVLPINL